MNSVPDCMVFAWGLASNSTGNKQYYESFSLNGEFYRPGDTVCLFNENESLPPHLGRITACFSSLQEGQDPQCIEVRWFERLTNLEPSLRGVPGRERELVELEEADVNSIGCISGKCHVFVSGDFDHAASVAKAAGVHSSDWYFCRGILHQATSTFQLYPELEDPMAFYQQPIMGPEDVADSEELVISCPSKRQRMDTPSRLNNLSAPDSSDAADNTTQRRKATSTHSVVAVSAANNERFCVECGATHTPQWREGPQGPKTLCNACGVRYNRALQRAAKRGGALPTRPPSPCGRGRGSRARAAAAAVMEPATVTGPTRPTRQASVMAAARTAECARAGAFPVVHLPALCSSQTSPAHTPSLKRLTPDSDQHRLRQAEPQCPVPCFSHDFLLPPLECQQQQQPSRDSSHNSHNSTDFAGHVCGLSPDRGEAPGGGLPQGSAATATANEPCFMGGWVGQGEVIGPEHIGTPVCDIPSVARRVASFVPGMGELGEVVAQWEEVREKLSPQAVAALMEVGLALERAASEAAAADAALDAVHQVLVARKQAADQARDSAAAAAARMRAYLAQLAALYPACSALHPADALLPAFPGLMEGEGELELDGIPLLHASGCHQDPLCGDGCEDITLALGPLDHGLLSVQH